MKSTRLLLLMSTCLLVAVGTSKGGAREVNQWCGTTADDFACRTARYVEFQPPGAARFVPLGTTARIPPNTTLRTRRAGTARLTLRKQAICTLGYGTPTTVVTRYAGYLFYQAHGYTLCRVASLKGLPKIPVYCDPLECTVTVEAFGSGFRITAGSLPLGIDNFGGQLRIFERGELRRTIGPRTGVIITQPGRELVYAGVRDPVLTAPEQNLLRQMAKFVK